MKRQARYQLINNNSGQTLTEYMLILLCVVLASATLISGIGKKLRSKIDLARDHIGSDITLEDKRD